MQLLKFVGLDGKPIGLICWFPVHGTSLNSTNRLISSDNKGAAAIIFEQKMDPNNFPGKTSFVAGFVNSNAGDASPNTNGAQCSISKVPCDIETSTCGRMAQNIQLMRRRERLGKRFKRLVDQDQCIASGPGKDMYESAKYIGEKQFKKAWELYHTATYQVSGPISYVYQTIDMSNIEVVLPDNQVVHTCKPAYGFSFAAGTTDGPGEFMFYQGWNNKNSFVEFLNSFLFKATKDMTQCHFPKPILIPTGNMKFPYPWSPTIVPTQILKIGNILISTIPAEMTTMSGRRLKESILDEWNKFHSDQKVEVLLSTLSNAYSSYVTTFEEYQKQRYEAASTIFGPYTLSAYIQQYRMLTSHLAIGREVPPGPPTPDLLDRQITLKSGVMFDGSPLGANFGDVLQDVKPEYKPGDTVMVRFVSANPRNDLQTEGTFLTVERYSEQNEQWTVIATDAHWETK